MKNLKSIAVYLFVTGMLGTFASCEKEKENSFVASNTDTKLYVRPLLNDDRVGEEDEEEVIQGRFVDENDEGIANATIRLMQSSDTTEADSDITSLLGEFQVSAETGNYLFKISIGSNNPFFTEVFELKEDLQIVIQQ